MLHLLISTQSKISLLSTPQGSKRNTTVYSYSYGRSKDYDAIWYVQQALTLSWVTHTLLVRLGKSGLKVSKIILGCMTYGNASWGKWIIDDEEVAIKHIKTAFAAGINVSPSVKPFCNNLTA